MSSVQEQATKDVKIRREQISKCMIQQPSLYLRYAMLLVRAKASEKLNRLQMEEREGFIHRKLRDEESSRPTSHAVLARCWKDAKWKKLRLESEVLSSETQALELICKSFEHRRDMLINVGATAREEMRTLHTRTKE